MIVSNLVWRLRLEAWLIQFQVIARGVSDDCRHVMMNGRHRLLHADACTLLAVLMCVLKLHRFTLNTASQLIHAGRAWRLQRFQCLQVLCLLTLIQVIFGRGPGRLIVAWQQVDV